MRDLLVDVLAATDNLRVLNLLLLLCLGDLGAVKERLGG